MPGPNSETANTGSLVVAHVPDAPAVRAMRNFSPTFTRMRWPDVAPYHSTLGKKMSAVMLLRLGGASGEAKASGLSVDHVQGDDVRQFAQFGGIEVGISRHGDG